MIARRGTPADEAVPLRAQRHLPVLLPQVIAALAPEAGQTFIDGTFGAGGYTRAILDAAPDVSVLALGCMSWGDPSRGGHQWVLDEETARGLIKDALDAGITFFDTANVYSAGSSEEITARAHTDFARR